MAKSGGGCQQSGGRDNKGLPAMARKIQFVQGDAPRERRESPNYPGMS
jgi:hypothetical protein